MTVLNPRWFDWGTWKPYGNLIFLASLACYAGAVAICFVVVRRIGKRVGFSKLIYAIGLLGCLPMLYQMQRSLMHQGSTAHYQEYVHIPALFVIATTVAIYSILGLIVEIASWLRSSGDRADAR